MTAAATKHADEPIGPAAVPPPPPRRRRWPRVVLLVALVLVAAWLWLVPPIVRAIVVDRLHAAGFRDVSIAELRVGFASVRARDVRIAGDGGAVVSLPGVVAEFALGDLLAGRVDALTIEGPTWQPGAGSAASPFDQIAKASRDPTSTRGTPNEPNEPNEPKTALPALPVSRLTIRGARILGPQPVAFDAEIVASASHWDVTARAAGAGQGVQVTAKLDVAPQRASGPVTLRAAGERPLEIHGTLAASMVDGARVLDVELRRDAAPFDVHVGGTTATGDGGFTLRAHVPTADLAAATVEVALDDFGVETSNGVKVVGLAGALKLAGLPLPVSSGPQRVMWRSAKLAMLEVGEGNLDVELQPDLGVLANVEQKTKDGSGMITFRDLRYARNAGSVPAHVVFDHVPLQDWLEALSKGRITGEGRLSGSVDLILRWAPRLDIVMQGGHLTSDSGIVHFLEDEETRGMIRAHVEQIAEASGHGNIVKERLVGALQEFAYHMLDFRLEPEPDGQGVTLSVHTAGKGRIVPQELDLTVNLHGFDAALETAFALKLGLDRAKQRLDDKIDKAETKPRNQQR